MTDFPWVSETPLFPWYWYAVVSLLALVVYLAYLNVLQHPRYLEKTMARKKEREQVQDLILTAFERELAAGDMSVKTQQKWLAKIGKSVGLPDLIPRNHHQLPFKFKPNLHKTKTMVMKRLWASGLDVVGFLKLKKEKSPAQKKITPRKIKVLPLP